MSISFYVRQTPDPPVITGYDPDWVRSGVTLSENNTKLTKSLNSNAIYFGGNLISHSSGKWYCEMLAYSSNPNSNFGLGAVEAGHSMTTYPGWDSGVFCIGRVSYNFVARINGGSNIYWGSQVSTNNNRTYMFAADLDTGRFWWGHGGGWYSGSDPVTGSGGISAPSLVGKTLYLATAVVNSVGTTQMTTTLRERSTDMIYTIPSGFTAWANE